MKSITDIFKDSVIHASRYWASIPKTNKKIYLTAKEAIVIKHLVNGKRLKQIAGDELISIHTVNSHMAHIKGKLGCGNTFDLGLMLGQFLTPAS